MNPIYLGAAPKNSALLRSPISGDLDDFGRLGIVGGGPCFRALGNVAKLGPVRVAGLMVGGGSSAGIVGSRSRTSLLLRRFGIAGAPGRSGEPPGRVDGPMPWLDIMLIMLTPPLGV
ncbi:uncharacterized protein PG986_009858 [Apiospora aurea]|uniref:Uncharacterized protein n=1 Tax=Apiospora aurea TaxID=335848 RepID=A0ABR1Q9J9_9PEZI